jgi:hypothetical protein
MARFEYTEIIPKSRNWIATVRRAGFDTVDLSSKQQIKITESSGDNV